MSKKLHIRSKGTVSILRFINNVAVFVRAALRYGVDPKEILAGSGISYFLSSKTFHLQKMLAFDA